MLQYFEIRKRPIPIYIPTQELATAIFIDANEHKIVCFYNMYFIIAFAWIITTSAYALLHSGSFRSKTKRMPYSIWIYIVLQYHSLCIHSDATVVQTTSKMKSFNTVWQVWYWVILDYNISINTFCFTWVVDSI